MRRQTAGKPGVWERASGAASSFRQHVELPARSWVRHAQGMVDPADWLLTRRERANPLTRLDELHGGDQAWSQGNHVRPLIHGATYFRALYDALEATGPGDLVLFTDWQGD